MGGEFGQWREWNHDASLDWKPARRGLIIAASQNLIRDLNRIYRAEPGGCGKQITRPGGVFSGSMPTIPMIT